MVRRGRVTLAFAVLAAAAAACQLIEDIHTRISPDQVAPTDASMPPRDAPPGSDAGADAGSPRDAGTDSGAICALPLPVRPDDATANPEAIEFFTAVRTVFYKDTDGGPQLGYNLDCVDTCPGPPSCRSTMMNCDQPGGLDMAANQLLQAVDNISTGSGQADFNSRIASGIYTIILDVSGWNGTANDANVTLAILVSSGLIPDPDSGMPSPPNWDGNDEWNIDPRSYTGSPSHELDGSYLYGSPRALTLQAYVSDYTLVATFPQAQFGLGLGGLVTMTNLVSTATITPLDGGAGGYRLDGQLTGRIDVVSVLTGLAYIVDPTNRGSTLCGNDPTYLTLRTLLCTSADIMSMPSADNTDASCNALSSAVGFSAFPAKLGAPYTLSLFTTCEAGTPVDCDGF